MAFHVFLFFLLLCLAWLWHLYWLHHNPPHPRVGAIHTRIQRLLKPRTPLDCPACHLSSTLSSGMEPSPLSVRPWREVKSLRGAPKRVNTEASPVPASNARTSALQTPTSTRLFGDGKHGLAERIQAFRGSACHTTFTARRHTPLYRLKTPSHQTGIVLSALAEGLDASAAERVFGYRQATITTWLTRAGKHAGTLHERSFHTLYILHLQLDELRTRLRSAKQML